jgi:hypothetical protein
MPEQLTKKRRIQSDGKEERKYPRSHAEQETN